MRKFRLRKPPRYSMSFNTNRSFTCIYCGGEYSALKPDNIHTKANIYKINRNDIQTTHKCNECGKITKLYWSEQEGSNQQIYKKNWYGEIYKKRDVGYMTIYSISYLNKEYHT